MRSDWAIRFDVCDRLVHEAGCEHVYASVRSGEVRLSGHVANRRTHEAAVRIAADVSGVRAIRDDLDIDANAGQEDFAEEAGPKSTEFGDADATRAILSNDFEKAPP
jgi:hypothetical protein